MNNTVSIQRLATGVPGLDAILGGGLPEFSLNLIAGPPGCGKTTFAHQIMFALATEDRPALYFTVLGEPPLKMLRYQQQFGFFDGNALNRSIHLINLAEDTIAGDFDRVLAHIATAVEAHAPAFVFIDSFLSIVLAQAGADDGHNALQRFVQRLGMLMSTWQATTFLLGEYFDEAASNPVFTIADGLIWLRQSVQRNSMVRKIEVIKMRGQPTLPGLHTFRIGRAGIEVFAPAPLLARVAPAEDAGLTRRGLDDRLSMGVPGLDDMLGGGLPRGYSLLVAGPSGSGKSILAAAFLAEGARCGETGVFATFEQHPYRSRDPLLADLVKLGRVGLVDNRSTDLSFDEIVLLLLTEVRRLGASRVVVDSLSAFELALAPTFRDDFRESLSRLIGSLAGNGVTLLMTSELEDRYTDLRFSPYGTAFLSDAIIVQRYIEIDSRVRRVMAVIKVRASSHAHELREFTIGDDGIRVGEMFDEHEGLLGGRPMRKRPADRVAEQPASAAEGALLESSE